VGTRRSSGSHGYDYHSPHIQWDTNTVTFGDDCLKKGCVKKVEVVCSPDEVEIETRSIDPLARTKEPITENLVVAQMQMTRDVTERNRTAARIVAHLGYRPGRDDARRIRTKTSKEGRDFVQSTLYCSPERVTNGRQPFVLEQRGQVRSRAESVNNGGFGAGDAST
jgi:hypothetical protein